MSTSQPNAPIISAESCDAKPLDWALLVLTILTTHVIWWALHLPTIFREGPKRYINDIAWECLRMHQPGYAGIVSCVLHPRDAWQAKYYTGRTSQLSTFKKYVTPFLIDSLLIASSILSIYRLCIDLHVDTDLSVPNSSLWSYPSLPVALTSLWIVFASRTKMRLRFVFLGHFFLIAAVGTAVALVIHFNDPGNTILWCPTLLAFVCMGVPFAILAIRLRLLQVVLAAMSRAVGPIVGALSPGAYFPFCQLRGMRFAGPLIAFTVLGSFLALHAMTMSWREYSEELLRRKRVKEERRQLSDAENEHGEEMVSNPAADIHVS